MKTRKGSTGKQRTVAGKARRTTAKAKKRRRRATPTLPRIIPGELLLRSEPIEANARRAVVELEIANTGDRPIQVGSHYHFYEVNRALRFDRDRSRGLRLDIAAGTAVRFEPGQKKTVALVALAGRREVWGLNGLVNGPLG